MRQKLTILSIAAFFIGLISYRVWQYASVPSGEHFHAQGAGSLVSLGGDRYHVEAVLTTDGLLKLYMLGQDSSRVLPVEDQKLTAHIQVEGEAVTQSIVLRSEPQSGDLKGTTSCFYGRVPPQLVLRPLRFSIPNLHISGERFHLTFAHDAFRHLPDMPEVIAEAEQRQLHLSPGGMYTVADIAANGRTVPSKKYQQFQARHDANPETGDRLCPVTRTKSHPDCRWTINGQEYFFCCPPCIDEYVRLAKEHPDELMPSETFVEN